MNITHKTALGFLLVLGLAHSGFAVQDTNGIPAPADMKAEVIVSGHTSTAKDIDVVNIGARTPYTYSLRPCATNIDGFACYVSKHFALRTDYPEERARFMLELLELAFPHYIEAFGAPPDIENRRIPCAYGKSYQSTTAVMMSDGFERGPGGGGEAMFYNGVAYCYPCGNKYHDEYIILHECTHAFQFAAEGGTQGMPGWYVEGMADGLSSHSYDPQKKRLTVFQFNRWGYHNWQASGLADHRVKPSWPGGERGQNVLAVNFLMCDSLRLQKFRVYRDEMFRISPTGSKIYNESARLLAELYGPTNVLAQQYMTWVANTRQVFKAVEGPWTPDDADFSVTDMLSANLNRLVMDLPPGEPLDDFYRFDRGGPEPTPLVGPVHCGVAQPAVGCVVDFEAPPGGGSLAGLGLGVVAMDGGMTSFPESSFYVDKGATRNGVNVAVYQLRRLTNGGKRSKDVINGALAGKGVDSRIALGLDGSPTSTLGLTENFVVEWDGWLRVDKGGPCWFTLRSDDGSWLWIDSKLLVDNGEYRGAEMRAAGVILNAGMHRIRARYVQGGGAAVFEAGLAHGNGLPGSLNLLIADGHSLAVDGQALGIDNLSLPLPDDIVLTQTGGVHRIGITAQIGKNKLDVELRADTSSPKQPVLHVSIPLTPAQRDRLMTAPVVLLARHVSCKLALHMDENHPYFNLDEPASANMWRNPADSVFARVEKACWRLGTNAPQSLTDMEALLDDSAMKGRPAQEEALASFKAAQEQIVGDIAKIGGGQAHAAIADLSGLTLDMEHKYSPDGGIVVVVRNPTSEPAKGSYKVSMVSATGGRDEAVAREITVPAEGSVQLTQAVEPDDEEAGEQVVVDADFDLSGHGLQLRAQTPVQPNPGLSMRFSPAVEFAEKNVTAHLVFTGPIYERAGGTVVVRADPPDSVETPEVTNKITVTASSSVEMPVSFQWRKGPVAVSLHACASLSASGEPIKIEDSIKIEQSTNNTPDVR